MSFAFPPFQRIPFATLWVFELNHQAFFEWIVFIPLNFWLIQPNLHSFGSIVIFTDFCSLSHFCRCWIPEFVSGFLFWVCLAVWQVFKFRVVSHERILLYFAEVCLILWFFVEPTLYLRWQFAMLKFNLLIF